MKLSEAMKAKRVITIEDIEYLNEEDREFIVKACNSHEALVQACKAMLNDLTFNITGIAPSMVIAQEALKLAGEE